MAPIQTPRRTALVTGASAGIGAEFARLYADRGLDLVLTARRADRLEALAAGLRDAHGVQVLVLPLDLAEPDAPGRLGAELRARDVHVDVLVNNAGYAVPGSYRNTPWAVQAVFLQVMVVAYAELVHRLLPPMIERRWGRIVNVASLAGLAPGSPGHTLYGASKAFLIKFSESLGFEVQRFGVHVTAVCPGFTHTEFHQVAGVEDLKRALPRFMWMDAATVARQGYDASEAGRLVYVPGRVNQAIAGLLRLLPQRLVYSVVRRNAGRVRRA